MKPLYWTNADLNRDRFQVYYSNGFCGVIDRASFHPAVEPEFTEAQAKAMCEILADDPNIESDELYQRAGVQ